MSYTFRFLQFGSNNAKVPGWDKDLIVSNEPVPVPEKLVDPSTNDIWSLVFCYESGRFYRPGDSFIGDNGAIVQCWYTKAGGNGDHVLAFTPFLIEEHGGVFARASRFVQFSQPTLEPNSIDTDTMHALSVTATVHPDLPEYHHVSWSFQSISNGIVITTTTTDAPFDSIFVYAGSAVPTGDKITVKKNESCFALAVFKLVKTVTRHEKDIIFDPRIPPKEWIQITARLEEELIKEVNELAVVRQ